MKPDKKQASLWMMGAAITFPFILASGPLAGYFISQYILVKQFGMSTNLVPLLTGLGFLASGLQIYQLIKRIKTFEEQLKKKLDS